MNNLLKINQFAARLLMVSFFFQKNLQSLSTILVCVLFLLEAITTKTIEFNWKKVAISILFGSGFLLCLIALIFTPHEYSKALGKICETKLSILLLPVIFSLLGQNWIDTLIKEKIYFVYAAVTATVLGNLRYIAYMIGSGGQFGNASHVQYRQFLEKVMDIHPTYQGIYLSFAVCILLFSKPNFGKVTRVFKFVLLYLLVFFLLASLAKAPIIALIFILIHFAWTKKETINTYFPYLAILGSIVVVAYFFVPFIGQRINELLVTNSNSDVHNNSVNERKMILETDLSLLKQYWLTGVGPGRLKELLDLKYFFYSISHNFTSQYYDPHNEYLWQWLSFGIIGFVFSIAVTITHFIKAINTKNMLYLYFLIIMATTFFTESVLARQRGVILFGVFASLFYFLDKKNKGIVA